MLMSTFVGKLKMLAIFEGPKGRELCPSTSINACRKEMSAQAHHTLQDEE